MFEALDYILDRLGNKQPGLGDRNGRYSLSYFFRDITVTARANLTRGQESVLLAAPAGTWVDLIALTAANQSTNAVSVDIRAGTGGGIQDTLTIAANQTLPLEYVVPIPQDEQAATWTAQVQGADISDSPVTISFIGVKNT